MTKKKQEKTRAKNEQEEQKNVKAAATSPKKTEKKEEDSIAKELKAEKDKFLRLFAEFENYKKRTTKERIELYKTAGEDVIVSLLPILDDFERALIHIKGDKESKSLLDGVDLIFKKMQGVLSQKGLKVMRVNKGDAFDSETQEAVSQIPSPEKKLKGKIIDVVEKGYQLGDKIIRYPKVVIGQWR